MQISSRFTIALHIFSCVDVFGGNRRVTSDFLAESIHTNPVIIRKILTQLKNAGLITVQRGTGGIEVTRDLSDISFCDVYEAIAPVENGDLFRFHESPNPKCPVGRNIISFSIYRSIWKTSVDRTAERRIEANSSEDNGHVIWYYSSG